MHYSGKYFAKILSHVLANVVFEDAQFISAAPEPREMIFHCTGYCAMQKCTKQTKSPATLIY
jgi:hypothetical protein